MKPEGIKVGDYHPVLARVGYKNKKGNYGITIQWGDGVQETRSLTPAEVCAMFYICETKPKYDPCRKFRKGDIVRLREYNGRKPYDFWHKQTIKHFGAKLDTVYEDEKEDSGHVDIYQDAPIDELMVRVHASYLELVTPVEELEPYYISTNRDCSTCTIFKRTEGTELVYAAYYFTQGKGCSNALLSQEEAIARAEAECARLNAEYRKEQEK